MIAKFLKTTIIRPVLAHILLVFMHNEGMQTHMSTCIINYSTYRIYRFKPIEVWLLEESIKVE